MNNMCYSCYEPALMWERGGSVDYCIDCFIGLGYASDVVWQHIVLSKMDYLYLISLRLMGE